MDFFVVTWQVGGNYLFRVVPFIAWTIWLMVVLPDDKTISSNWFVYIYKYIHIYIWKYFVVVGPVFSLAP